MTIEVLACLKQAQLFFFKLKNLYRARKLLLSIYALGGRGCFTGLLKTEQNSIFFLLSELSFEYIGNWRSHIIYWD